MSDTLVARGDPWLSHLSIFPHWTSDGSRFNPGQFCIVRWVMKMLGHQIKKHKMINRLGSMTAFDQRIFS
jgi:hypothetical protein